MSLFNAHGMQPDVVLGMAGMLGAEAGRVLLVGCEPASVDEGIGLSAPVQRGGRRGGPGGRLAAPGKPPAGTNE